MDQKRTNSFRIIRLSYFWTWKIRFNAIASVTDQVPDPHTRHYAGDIRYPIRLSGAPAFGIGSLAGNFYGPHEWVDIDDLVNLVAVTILTMESWAEEL